MSKKESKSHHEPKTVDVKIAPDKKVKLPAKLSAEVPKIGIYRWKAAGKTRAGTNAYVRELTETEAWLPLTDVARLAEIPMERDTIRRLALGEFIRSSRPSPGVLLIDIVSLFEHLEKTSKNPEFWQHPPHIARWRETRKALYKLTEEEIRLAQEQLDEEQGRGQLKFGFDEE